MAKDKIWDPKLFAPSTGTSDPVDKAKLDHITISQDVNLDTVEGLITATDTKITGITYDATNTHTNLDHNILLTTAQDPIADISVQGPELASTQRVEDMIDSHFSNSVGFDPDTDKIAIGHEAGETNQESYSVAIGQEAGRVNQSTNTIALGYYSGHDDQSSNSIAIGSYAGETTQGTHAIAIGNESGNTNQEEQAIAIGDSAGNTGQSNYAIAIGNASGKTDQGGFAVGIGWNAGSNNQGASATAIGNNAGDSNQGLKATAIGYYAGRTDQGEGSVAIGNEAGESSQADYSLDISSYDNRTTPTKGFEITYENGTKVFNFTNSTTDAVLYLNNQEFTSGYPQSDGALNRANITTNTSDIATNKTAISTNANNITTNTNDIADNGVDIIANTTNIAKNETDINSHASTMAQHSSDISDNASNIAANTGDITTNKNDITALKSLSTSAKLTDLSDVNLENTNTPNAGQVLGYDDNTKTWIPVDKDGGGTGGIADAPSDGKTYGRNNAGWSEVEMANSYDLADPTSNTLYTVGEFRALRAGDGYRLPVYGSADINFPNSPKLSFVGLTDLAFAVSSFIEKVSEHYYTLIVNIHKTGLDARHIKYNLTLNNSEIATTEISSTETTKFDHQGGAPEDLTGHANQLLVVSADDSAYEFIEMATETDIKALF